MNCGCGGLYPCWERVFRGDLVRASLQLHLVMPCKQVDAFRAYNLLIHSKAISKLKKIKFLEINHKKMSRDDYPLIGSMWSMAQRLKNLSAMQGTQGLIPGSERSSGEGNGYSLQYSCLGNPIDREVWWGYSPWGCKSWTRLSN